MPDQPCAICACGHRLAGQTCVCNAVIYAQNFFEDEARANELLLDKDKILKQLSNTASRPEELQQQHTIQIWLGMAVGTPILLFIIYSFTFRCFYIYGCVF